MSTLLDMLAPEIPSERMHKKFGMGPITLASLLAGGVGLGALGMAVGKNSAKAASKQAAEAVSRGMLEVGGEPVFHSRLANSLANIDPFTKVPTVGHLWKAAQKGGGASRGELELAVQGLMERSGRSESLLDTVSDAMSDFTGMAGRSISDDTPLPAKNIGDFLEYMKNSKHMPMSVGSTEMPASAPKTDMMLYSPVYRQYNPPGGENYTELGIYGRGSDDLAAAAKSQTDHMQHISPTGGSALAFALTKEREASDIGRLLSVEQLQSDFAEQGLSGMNPAIAKDFKRRYPDIMMAYLAKKAAANDMEGVMWHPGDAVRAATYGRESGQNAWYGVAGEPGGRLYDAASKLQKQIPGSELVQTMGVDMPRPIMHPTNDSLDDFVQLKVSEASGNAMRDRTAEIHRIHEFISDYDKIAGGEMGKSMSRLANAQSEGRKVSHRIYKEGSVPYIRHDNSPRFDNPIEELENRAIENNAYNEIDDDPAWYWDDIPWDDSPVEHYAPVSLIKEALAHDPGPGFQAADIAGLVEELYTGQITVSERKALATKIISKINSLEEDFPGVFNGIDYPGLPGSGRNGSDVIQWFNMNKGEILDRTIPNGVMAAAEDAADNALQAIDSDVEFASDALSKLMLEDERVSPLVKGYYENVYMNKARKGGSRWVLKLPKEAREKLAKMTFPFLSAGGLTAGAYATGQQR